MKMTNKMQLCRIIYYSLAALHVSRDIFAHHQGHLNRITASGITQVCRCRLVSWECWNWLYYGSAGTDFIMGVLELTLSWECWNWFIVSSNTPMIPWYPSARRIGPSQRPPSVNTQHSRTDKEPCPHRYSNSLLQAFLECEIYPL